MIEMERYSRIDKKLPREFLLLQGMGCPFRCRYCDYVLDASKEPFEVNKSVLDRVTGEFGILDIINSGSVFELDGRTLDYIQQIVQRRGIHTLWVEAHYNYASSIDRFRREFPGVLVKFRTGVESFDHNWRVSMNKGMPDVSPEQIRSYFDGVCLLVAVEGQTHGQIRDDLRIASSLFEYFSVNVFCPNSTPIRRDDRLATWFESIMYPQIKDLPNCEVLLHNTDLGVGVDDPE
jgi:hypothetical protein